MTVVTTNGPLVIIFVLTTVIIVALIFPHEGSIKVLSYEIKAVVVLEGEKVAGDLLLEQEAHGYGIHVFGNITGLHPGKHGITVNEFGDLRNKCMNTGDHYDPEKVGHGDLNAFLGDYGDLGNIEADKKGNALVDIRAHKITFAGNNSVMGMSIVVYESEDDAGLGDDEGSKEHGNVGGPIACGIIAVAKII